MKIWLIIVLFLVVMFFDGAIFPGLFGFRESFLTVMFIVIMILQRKVDFQGLILGVVFSGTAEFYWGLRFGILISSLLVSTGVFFLLNTFFNIRSKASVIITGVIMFIIFWEASILVSKII
ncbi:MAG: hypothetical protein A2915_02610 [Candidatus Yanofskybacteria bacterium RIFCSPLOWO2_01_FULL_41_34]|uniref:Uncharacterized protein n=1 Tax=Candidatus Yanofskybacteria bacterium RIFCSPHIGHO2_01_FULL_41_26 TaxID=1802661 RepID=A0A1F8EEK1_9BACT|nr:MAG: hypothetical protein A2649_03980 [Candidatus Yanofskybacteria bacterium RIFCSPHIGHO2_01_FULL_41_26]OGN20929.1 MAG: hypothetical protein A2915_02610 [Candidatus Yanofskybacteria bacterium RIFCSPLOWO2_01_FULL_41_34]